MDAWMQNFKYVWYTYVLYLWCSNPMDPNIMNIMTKCHSIENTMCKLVSTLQFEAEEDKKNARLDAKKGSDSGKQRNCALMPSRTTMFSPPSPKKPLLT